MAGKSGASKVNGNSNKGSNQDSLRFRGKVPNSKGASTLTSSPEGKDADAPPPYSSTEKNQEADGILSDRPLFLSAEEETFWRQWEPILIPVFLTLLSMGTRLYKIGWSTKVVWDEAHFGKFGNHYLNRTFYHDVHPPLGKMLVGLSGYLAGNNGTFTFESGKAYPPEVNYLFQRIFSAIFGIVLVPLAYFTALNLQFSKRAAVLVASLVLLDNALCVISRFILLDSMLLAFTALSFYCLTGFHTYQSRPFTFMWWVYLLLTGVSIGLASSVKWVGLFIVALVGLYTVADLYHKFGELELPLDHYLLHWVARILGLILLPFLIYMASFYVHFSILTRSGPGDATMSSLFQAHLENSFIGGGPLYVGYGSKVTIKSYAFGGGLLHSHPSLYPEGSAQHQVTIYHHSDSNNDWVILRDHTISSQRRESLKNQNSTQIPESASEYYIDADELLDEPVQMLHHGDIIRLSHVGTGANLHSHRVTAPISDRDYEVSGYLQRDQGDVNDHWVVEVYDDVAGSVRKEDGLGSDDRAQIRILSTRFRLRHSELNCYLMISGERLPDWGFGQGEVVCSKKVPSTDARSLWNIENHNNGRLELPPPGKFPIKSPFLRDFVHLNVAMWNSNNALTPDKDKEDALTSKPYHWPLMMRGIRMCGWGDDTIKFYMLGNPLIWWGTTLSLLIMVALWLVYQIRFRRGFREWYQAEWETFNYTAQLLITGYILQYIPYLLMGRVTYVHHYFPALYIALFSPGFLLDHFTRRHGSLYQTMCFVVLVMCAGWTFVYFSPMTFGMDFPAKDFASRNWLSGWQLSEL